MVWKLLKAIPKTLWLNFRCFDFKTAIKMPIIVSNRVNCKGIKKGNIIIDSASLKPGMIRLGLSDGAYERGKYKRSYLSIAKEGTLIFKGTAHIANEFAINIVGGGYLSFGDNFASNYGLIVSCENEIQFGKDVLLGWDCTFIDGDGHDILDSDGTKTNQSKAISIGNHVWMAAKVTGLKGCSIADDSVVGYGSIITKSMNCKNCIVSGYPAKQIKESITWKH